MSMKSFLIFSDLFSKIAAKVEQAEDKDAYLACQKSPQIAFDPEDRDQHEYACNPYSQTCRVDAERKLRPSDPVDDTDQSTVGI